MKVLLSAPASFAWRMHGPRLSAGTPSSSWNVQLVQVEHRSAILAWLANRSDRWTLAPVALRSRKAWLKLAQESNIWLEPCGRFMWRTGRMRWQVLQEIAQRAPALGYDCQLLSPQQVLAKTPAANQVGLLGGLYSPSECSVNPRLPCVRFQVGSASAMAFSFRFNTLVTQVDGSHVVLSNGERIAFDRCIVCSGSDLQMLYPQQYAASGIRQCKLQMLRTGPQPANWKIGTHLASGLTLRHYACFQICPHWKRSNNAWPVKHRSLTALEFM